MNVMWDIILSFFIGAWLIVMAVSEKADLSQRNYQNILYLSAQNRAETLKQILENDLHKAGIGITGPGSVFITSDSTGLSFKGDVDLDGIVDTVRYYEGNAAVKTENPNDIIVFRQSGSQSPESYTMGVCYIRFKYYNSENVRVYSPSAVKNIEYRFYLENPTGYNGNYPGIFIQGRVKPRNIR